MQTTQEYFTTIVYAKFGGQTECIMDNWKIVNNYSQLKSDIYVSASLIELGPHNEIIVTVAGIAFVL